MNNRLHNLASWSVVLTILFARLVCLCANPTPIKVEKIANHSCCKTESSKSKPAEHKHDPDCPHCVNAMQLLHASTKNVDSNRNLTDITLVAHFEYGPIAHPAFVSTFPFVRSDLPSPIDVLRQACALLQ